MHEIIVTNSNDFMTLEVCISESDQCDPARRHFEFLASVQQMGSEISSIYMKCRKIKQIDGKPASIVGLRLTGERFIENMKISYVHDGHELQKSYDIDDFYRIS